MMGRRRFWLRWTWLWLWLWVWTWTCCEGAVIPPRWVNATLNPCAKKSWQLLYWPQDHSCHRIFTQGPCRDTQEFYYNRTAGVGACRCPRGTLHYKPTGLCYPEFTKGPCPPRKYLAGDSVKEEGICQEFTKCPPRHVFWPRTNKCYEHHTQGPCLKGYLLFVNQETGFPDCGCDKNLMFSNYWSLTGLCFELFKRGPCLEGDIFLYNATKGSTECSCSASILTNYHRYSEGCYELNHQGPCNPGQVFNFNPHTMLTACTCREDHALWPPNGYCYRLYSRGPCAKGHFFRIINNSSTETTTGECMEYPCSGTRRYHPETNDCYRLGWRGPCPEGQLFIYDEDSPLRGTCGCTEELIGYWPQDDHCYELGGRGPCQHSQVLSYEKLTGRVHCTCDLRKGYVKWHDGHCYRLESRGPCSTGEMLAVKRWRPVTPTCTSLNSPVAPNSPLLVGNIPIEEGSSQHHHHQESNTVEAARADSTFTLGAINDTVTSENTNSSENKTIPSNHRSGKSLTTSHREGRQLSHRPAPTNIYSLGAMDSTYSVGNEDTTYSQGRSGRSMGDTETWGFLDDSYFKIPGENTGTYYTGRPDGGRSLSPWWGRRPTST